MGARWAGKVARRQGGPAAHCPPMVHPIHRPLEIIQIVGLAEGIEHILPRTHAKTTVAYLVGGRRDIRVLKEHCDE